MKMEMKMTMIFLLSSSMLLSVVSSSAESQAQEQQTLLKLKELWHDPSPLASWAASTNASSHCAWPEVTCHHDGSVSELHLYYKDISYPIPRIVCDLSNLTLLDVGNNSIPGGFPTVLYGCPKLTYLDISQNYFVGPIPGDVDRLTGLSHLIVTGNNFSSNIPGSIVNLKNLRELSIGQNQFNGTYPEGIFGMSSLEVLSLAYNYLLLPSKMPANLTALKRMRTLGLAKMNLFGDIPDSIGDMFALEYLDLGENNLTGQIPDSIFKLKNLTHLYLWANSLSGTIPRVVESLNLEVIDLSLNNLTGTIPEDFGKLQSLFSLVLLYNNLSGQIPESVGRIPSLTDVRLFGNQFSGILPPDFGRYSALTRFEVATNNFTGGLPENLCFNGKLLGLAAFGNNFVGSLPRSLGNCSSLLQVMLNDNNFSGNVPEGLWSSPNLTILMLNDNMLTGDLPDVFSPSLTHVIIGNNRFSGSIPGGISSAKSLQVLQASHNLLNGTIPVELTDLPQLNSLSLDGNQISGDIPTYILSWNSLGALNLSHNQISGPIPEALASLSVLTELDLSENQLSGVIPPQLGQRKFTFLNLSENFLTGSIPASFENGAYENSFLNNPGLCTSDPSVRLRLCNAGSTSSRRIRLSYLALIITVTFASLALASVLVLYMISTFRKKISVFNPTWKLTPFHKLSFTESDILPGLREHNMIGSGGSGKVYRVPVGQSNEVVAVKKICNSRKLEHRLEKEFLAEVEILGRIRHKNIVKLMCCISCENVKYLVYEYMANRSLDQWLHKKRMPSSAVTDRRVLLDWPQRLHIAIGAARGLSYMHHDCWPPIIHRDIKSSNVLIDSDFDAKIADFGLARMLLMHGEAATMSTVAGSFGYLAPEYGRTHRVNEKIDVYSFGVILLELTTGKEPNDTDDDMCLAEWAWQHIQEDKPIVDALDPDVREESNLREMVSVFKLGIACTGTFPSHRPSMKQVVEYLLKCGEQQPDGKYPDTKKDRDSSPLLLQGDCEDSGRPDHVSVQCHKY